MKNFVERHNTKIKGIISCFDRIVLSGTIPGICYAEGMTSLLFKKDIRIFDYTDFVEPLREEMKHFIDCCINGTEPRTDGYNGLRVVKTLVAAEKSIYSDSTTVEIS